MIDLERDCEMLILSEEQEKQTYRQMFSEPLQTRYMFYDMMQWRNKIRNS